MGDGVANNDSVLTANISGVEVLNVDKLTYAGNLNSLKSISDSENYSFAKLDICNYEMLESLVQDFKPDAIMHLAAESHVDRSIDAPETFITSNIIHNFKYYQDK